MRRIELIVGLVGASPRLAQALRGAVGSIGEITGPDAWRIDGSGVEPVHAEPALVRAIDRARAFYAGQRTDVGLRIVDAIQPRWLRIAGYWYPRGGIPIDVFWQTGDVPEGVWLPETGVEPYRGRG